MLYERCLCRASSLLCCGLLLLLIAGGSRAAEVSLGRDKWLRLDGKVVIPFGYYFGGREHEEARAGGANVAVLWSDHLDAPGRARFYAEAASWGPHILDALPMQQAHPGRPPLDTEVLEEILSQLSGQPALLGYYLADEPELGHATPEQVAALDACLKARDPNRLTVISNAFGGHEMWAERNQRYFDCADVIAFQVYAGHTGDGTRVIETLNWAVPLLAERRAAPWAVIWTGMFAASGHHANTPCQVRNHTYLALLHGARGLLFFRQEDAAASMPDTYPEEMEALAHEVGFLTPYLSSAEPVAQPAARPREIHIRSYRQGSEVVTIAINTAARTMRAALEIPQLPDRLEVLWEERVLRPTAEGWFEEVFSPWETHVYRFPPGRPLARPSSLPPAFPRAPALCYLAHHRPAEIPPHVGQSWQQAAEQLGYTLEISSTAILEDLERAESCSGMIYEGLLMTDRQARNAERFVYRGGRLAVVGVDNRALAYDTNRDYQFDDGIDYWGYVDYTDSGLSLRKGWCILPRITRCLVTGSIELAQVRVARPSPLTAGLPQGRWIDLQPAASGEARRGGRLSLVTSVLGRTLRSRVILEGRAPPTAEAPDPPAVPIAAVNEYGHGEGVWLALDGLPDLEDPVLRVLTRNLLDFLRGQEL